jgi:hypothetical protein
MQQSGNGMESIIGRKPTVHCTIELVLDNLRYKAQAPI